MSLLDGHLDQIALSAKSIEELEFPASRQFTNALLYNDEITTLIRDTEPHERALFSVDPSVSSGSSVSNRKANPEGQRRKTLGSNQQRAPSAVARVLGNDMLKQIQQSSRDSGRGKGINIEVLLRGAERLCAVYSVAGSTERIAALRNRHHQIASSIEHYEEKVAKQQARLNRSHQGYADESGVDSDEDEGNTQTNLGSIVVTEDDLRAEEDAVRDLEAKKKKLEERVANMEKNLGGLLR